MKQILVISGKGGTGKTSITAALCSIANNAVFADCDVDAADLHLILCPEIISSYEFIGGSKAEIDSSRCLNCGICKALCRFDAVEEADTMYINIIKCEGCGVCEWNCPINAISLTPHISGSFYKGKTRYGLMSYARLNPGGENSGKLVASVKGSAINIAKETNADWLIIDGPPGIGCPVIASLSGADIVVAVTEPTLSGLSDLLRVLELAKQFKQTIYVVINKYDINESISNKIESELINQGVKVIGRIAYTKEFNKAQLLSKSIMELDPSQATNEITKIWNIITNKEIL